jgi:hypothetical protein
MREGWRYGYDPDGGHLFGWDGEFHYLGRADAPPDSAHVVEDKRHSELFGCFYLSGEQYRTLCIRTNDQHFESLLLCCLRGNFDITVLPDEAVFKGDNPKQKVCLCGDAVNESGRVAAFCAAHPFNTVYVCPLTDELPAFGVLAEQLCREHKERPRRANLYHPFDEPLDAPCQCFDEKLGVEGDGLGQMAHLVAHGQPVLNQMRMGPGVPSLYNRVAVMKGDGVWWMAPQIANRIFPSATPSVKYAAESVPVAAYPDEETCKIVELEGPIPFMIANTFIPGSIEFVRFYMTIGRPMVCLIDPLSEGAPKIAPVFRYSRGYRPTPTQYKEALNDTRRPVRDDGDPKRRAGTHVEKHRSGCSES